MIYFDQNLSPSQLFLDSLYIPTHYTYCSILATSFEDIFTGQLHALLELNNELLCSMFVVSLGLCFSD